MKVSKIALATGLLLGGVAVAPLPAAAQYGSGSQRAEEQAAQGEQGPRQERRRGRGRQQAPAGPQLAAEEIPALTPLITAAQAEDWVAAAAAIPAAQAGATTPYGRYSVGRLMLDVARGTSNTQLQAQAVDAMLASGGVPPEALNTLLRAQASHAITTENWPVAESALTRLLEADATDAERTRQLAEVKIRLDKFDEALTIYQRLLQMGEVNGQHAPEDQYKRALVLARQVRNAEVTAQLSRTLLTLYPTPDNWRETLSVYRQASANDADVALDLRRLMRTAQAFNRSADYIEFADKLIRAGLLGEAKSLLDEGVARNVLQQNDSTVRQLYTSVNSRITEDRASLGATRTRALAASTGRDARIAGDAHLGYGQYSDAAALYRAALQKGGESADLLNMRLGVALALAGQRAEAETALRAVTGTRAQLANYWLLWLARTGG